MCRLYAQRSSQSEDARASLVGDGRSMASLSEHHPDGWGLATFGPEGTVLHKQPLRAGSDPQFHAVAGEASAPTLLCHIRKATHGGLAEENCHPFRHGRWVFAHNGTCYGFAGFRERLIARLREPLRARIAGQTDSEVLFYLLLSRLDAALVDGDGPISLDALARAARQATDLIWAEVPDRHPATCHYEDPTCLSFLLTDGEVLLAHQGGRPLHFVVDAPGAQATEARCGSQLRRLRVASEPLSCSDGWTALDTFEMVGAEPHAGDGSLRLRRFPPGLPFTAF
jgi:glutamine amidotransferase